MSSIAMRNNLVFKKKRLVERTKNYTEFELQNRKVSI